MPAGAVKRPVHLARTGRRDVQRNTLPISLSFPDRVFEAVHFDVVGGSGWILRRLSSLIAQATLAPEYRLAGLRQWSANNDGFYSIMTNLSHHLWNQLWVHFRIS